MGLINHVNNFTRTAFLGDSTMKTEPIILITRIGMVVFCLLALYLLLLIIFGNSPTVTDVLVVMTVSMVFYLVQNGFHRGKFEGKVESSFSHFKDDVKEMKKDLHEIKEQLRGRR